ncbi:MAG: preprotein translocase subunit SecE [Canibacter sp.]
MSGNEIEEAPSSLNRDKNGKKPSFVARIVLFIKQVIAELKKVVVPTRKELRNFFLVVLAFVIIMMLFVWLVDQLFGWLAVVVFGTPLA